MILYFNKVYRKKIEDLINNLLRPMFAYKYSLEMAKTHRK